MKHFWLAFIFMIGCGEVNLIDRLDQRSNDKAPPEESADLSTANGNVTDEVIADESQTEIPADPAGPAVDEKVNQQDEVGPEVDPQPEELEPDPVNPAIEDPTGEDPEEEPGLLEKIAEGLKKAREERKKRKKSKQD